MNQMEHNVKIKNYKRYEEPGPYVRTVHYMNFPHNLPNSQEQARMEDRFKQIYKPRETTIHSLKDHGDRMRFTRDQQISLITHQADDIRVVQTFRKDHLDMIKNNIDVARDKFQRDVRVSRPNARERIQGNRPMYKIINNGTLYGNRYRLDGQ